MPRNSMFIYETPFDAQHTASSTAHRTRKNRSFCHARVVFSREPHLCRVLHAVVHTLLSPATDRSVYKIPPKLTLPCRCRRIPVYQTHAYRLTLIAFCQCQNTNALWRVYLKRIPLSCRYFTISRFFWSTACHNNVIPVASVQLMGAPAESSVCTICHHFLAAANRTRCSFSAVNESACAP